MKYTTQHVHAHSVNELLAGWHDCLILSPSVEPHAPNVTPVEFKRYRATAFRARDAWEITAGTITGNVTNLRIQRVLRGGRPEQRVIWYTFGEELAPAECKKIVAYMANQLAAILAKFADKKRASVKDVFDILSGYDLLLADRFICPTYNDFTQEVYGR